MREKLKQVMAEVFEVDAALITEKSNMDNLDGWDSLSHIRLIAALEEKFGVTLTSDEIATLTSVAAVESVLQARV